MEDKNRIFLMVAFVAVVVLFFVFGGGIMTGWNGGGIMGGWSGGGMMGGSNPGNGTASGWTMGGIHWMWFPTIILLGLGVLFGWMIWGKKH